MLGLWKAVPVGKSGLDAVSRGCTPPAIKAFEMPRIDDYTNSVLLTTL
jgi:hypothetical protein